METTKMVHKFTFKNHIKGAKLLQQPTAELQQGLATIKRWVRSFVPRTTSVFSPDSELHY